MTEYELPELPEQAHSMASPSGYHQYVGLYTADQMHDYAIAALRQQAGQAVASEGSECSTNEPVGYVRCYSNGEITDPQFQEHPHDFSEENRHEVPCNQMISRPVYFAAPPRARVTREALAKAWISTGCNAADDMLAARPRPDYDALAVELFDRAPTKTVRGLAAALRGYFEGE